MTLLLTADTHFTSNPRDAGRKELFPWLRKQAKKTGAKAILLLGDGTDEKDRHKSELVNWLVNEVKETAACVDHFIWLMGNHDAYDPQSPFFGFLDNIDPRVSFIKTPTTMELDDGVNGARTRKQCLLLPATRNYKEDWAKLSLKGIDYVFCHQTFTGAEAENGTKLQGVPADFFAGFSGDVWSGDIHVPQRVGKTNIRYVGAAYRVRFGDAFTPRVVLLKNGSATDLHFPGVEKHLVTLKKLARLKTYEFPKGSQVKVRVQLHRQDLPEWKEWKRQIVEYAKAQEWQLFGPELETLPDDVDNADVAEAAKETGNYRKPVQVLKAYAKAHKLEQELTDTGLELLKQC